MPRRPQAGVTMLESLIAIVVLSLGMLGAVGLQAAALQSNKEARYQSSAVRLARELGELMRGNKDIAIATSAAANPYLVDFTGTLPVAGASCFTDACATTLEVASFQMRDWLARVAAELPGAHVKVCVDETPYTGAGLPQWDCSDSGGTMVVKIGWTQGSTDHGAVGSSGAGAAVVGLDQAVRPAVVLSLLAGSSE
jgi:type IV pilus assembly protein PilV